MRSFVVCRCRFTPPSPPPLTPLSPPLLLLLLLFLSGCRHAGTARRDNLFSLLSASADDPRSHRNAISGAGAGTGAGVDGNSASTGSVLPDRYPVAPRLAMPPVRATALPVHALASGPTHGPLRLATRLRQWQARGRSGGS